MGVDIAGEGGFINVRFRSSPAVTMRWMQGNISVTDEMTGAVYDTIAVMPSIGPLFARPTRPNQPGYVMLMNVKPGLQPGVRVTVVLGQFKQEHVVVQ
jgi:hypothetical protein